MSIDALNTTFASEPEEIAIKVLPPGPQIPFVPRTWVHIPQLIIEPPPFPPYRDRLSGFLQMPSPSACSPLSSADPENNFVLSTVT